MQYVLLRVSDTIIGASNVICNNFRHYPTLAPPGGLTLHVEKLLNSSFRINLLCLKDLAPFSYIYTPQKNHL